jgi:hypothetical protein
MVVWRQKERKMRSDRHACTNWQVCHIFKQLINGASLQGLLWLLNFERLRRRVYVYKHETHEAVLPDETIPWPIIWVCARFHRKHVLVGRALPKFQKVMEDLKTFSNKIKIEMAFQR